MDVHGYSESKMSTTDIQHPKGEFRRYIQWEGRWCHVYVLSTYYQTQLVGDPVKMVEFKLSKNAKEVHSAERSRFFESKPKQTKKKEQAEIA